MAQPASSPLLPLPRATANNRFELWKLGITHVLNAAHGGLYCQGGPDFYGSSVSYLGVPAHDLPDFDISAYFSSAADFIHRALGTPGGRTWGPISYPILLSLGGCPVSLQTSVPSHPEFLKSHQVFKNPLLCAPVIYPTTLLHRLGNWGLEYKAMLRVRSSPRKPGLPNGKTVLSLHPSALRNHRLVVPRCLVSVSKYFQMEKSSKT